MLSRLRVFTDVSLFAFLFIVLKNIDNLMTAEGVGLTTALRVLCNVACPPPPVEGNIIKYFENLHT